MNIKQEDLVDLITRNGQLNSSRFKMNKEERKWKSHEMENHWRAKIFKNEIKEQLRCRILMPNLIQYITR